MRKEDMIFLEKLRPFGFPTLEEIGIKENQIINFT